MSSFVNFITLHENDDTSRLLLSREKYPDINIPLAVSTIECRRKLQAKVPSFYAEPFLIYPDRLCAEQCSSEETARRKAEIIYTSFRGASATSDVGISEIATASSKPRNDVAGMRYDIRIADLTGGLGVDTVAFSKIASKVLYNEAKPELAEAARHNFKALGIKNIEVHNSFVTSGKATELLADFKPDLIFLDPARRAEDGRKVFLLEDCQPDILTLKDELLSLSRFVMVKLSPMADIDMVVKRLGSHCRLVEVISVGGECKELLALLDRDFDGECTITANCGGRLFTFQRSECQALGVRQCRRTLMSVAPLQPPYPGKRSRPALACPPKKPYNLFLLEPDKALMKTAPFKLLEQHFAIEQLDRDTHYYITDSSDLEKFAGYFKIFEILKTEPLNKRTMKAIAEEFPEAEVTARNIPMTSDELRKRLGTRPSDSYHIFGLKYRSQNSLFACRKWAP